jgi:hypothetical protein
VIKADETPREDAVNLADAPLAARMTHEDFAARMAAANANGPIQ